MAEDSFWNDLASCTTPEEEKRCAEYWSKVHKKISKDISPSNAPSHNPADISVSTAFSVASWGC